MTVRIKLAFESINNLLSECKFQKYYTEWYPQPVNNMLFTTENSVTSTGSITLADGLTYGEAEALLQSWDSTGVNDNSIPCSEVPSTYVCAEIDTNSDGHVSVEEFMQYQAAVTITIKRPNKEAGGMQY